MALDLSALDDDMDFGKAPAATPAPPAETAPRAPLSRFEEDPANPREEFDGPEWDEFCEDVAERGILQPIIVRPVGDKLRIRFGARRYRAAIRNKLPDAPYIVTEDERQFDDYSQVSENQQRKPLQPLELAKFIAKKLDQGEKKKDVAGRLKIDPSAVTHLLALVDAPAFLLDLYHSRQCRAPHYLYELRKLHEKNPEIVERRCAEADEVDKRLIVAIADAISPPPAVVEAGPMNIKDVMDNPGTGAGAGSSGAADGATTREPGTTEDGGENGGVQVQQVPFHNPENEKKEPAPSDPNRIKKPLLLGTYNGAEVMVLINQRPTAVGLVFIRDERTQEDQEVAIGDVVLTQLTEASK